MKRKYFDVAGKKFTLKQMQIVSKISEGGVHKNIAPELGIKKGTLDSLVSKICHKAGVPNAIALVALFVAKGLQPGGRFCGKKLFTRVRKKTKRTAFLSYSG